MKLGNPVEIGQLMRRKRQELGFTIKEMAEATGLSFVTILRLEQGRIGYVHGETVKKLESLKIHQDLLKRKTMQLVSVEVPPLLPQKQKATQETGDIEALPAAKARPPKALPKPREGLSRAILRAIRDHLTAKLEGASK